MPFGFARAWSYVAIAVIAAVIGFQAQHQWKALDSQGKSVFAVHDFEAFYCAGRTRDAGKNPYLAADYLDCAGRPAGYAPMREQLESPAPLPGYDIALFAIFAKLPYRLAAYLWLVLSLAAIFGGAIALARTVKLPPVFVAATFAIIGMVALFWGQLTPIALGALCLAAFAVEIDAMWLAGASVIVCALEPHIGLPAILGAAIFLPRSRIAIGIGIVVLLVASFAGAGLHENIQYFTKVTPLQIQAEVPMDNQYSLTWLMYAFGVPAPIGARIGSLSYLVMIVVGLALARPIARATGSGAAFLLVPVACAILGGPYIHSNQVALALPAVLLVAGRVRKPEPMLWISVALLAAAWSDPTWSVHPFTPVRLESLVLVAAVAYYAVHRVAPGRALLAAVGGGVAYLAITFAILHVSATPWDRPLSPVLYARQLGSDIAFASGRYGVTVRQFADQYMQFSWRAIDGKLPYWLALVAFVLRCIAEIKASPRATRS